MSREYQLAYHVGDKPKVVAALPSGDFLVHGRTPEESSYMWRCEDSAFFKRCNRLVEATHRSPGFSLVEISCWYENQKHVMATDPADAHAILGDKRTWPAISRVLFQYNNGIELDIDQGQDANNAYLASLTHAHHLRDTRPTIENCIHATATFMLRRSLPELLPDIQYEAEHLLYESYPQAGANTPHSEPDPAS